MKFIETSTQGRPPRSEYPQYPNLPAALPVLFDNQPRGTRVRRHATCLCRPGRRTSRGRDAASDAAALGRHKDQGAKPAVRQKKRRPDCSGRRASFLEMRLCHLSWGGCLIASSGKQTFHGNIFVQSFPVDAERAQLVSVEGVRISIQQTGKPCQRYADGAGVAEFNPHPAFIEVYAFRRNNHAKPPREYLVFLLP